MNPEEMYWRFVNELLIALKINRYLIILNILICSKFSFYDIFRCQQICDLVILFLSVFHCYKINLTLCRFSYIVFRNPFPMISLLFVIIINACGSTLLTNFLSFNAWSRFTTVMMTFFGSCE